MKVLSKSLAAMVAAATLVELRPGSWTWFIKGT